MLPQSNQIQYLQVPWLWYPQIYLHWRQRRYHRYHQPVDAWNKAVKTMKSDQESGLSTDPVNNHQLFLTCAGNPRINAGRKFTSIMWRWFHWVTKQAETIPAIPAFLGKKTRCETDFENMEMLTFVTKIADICWQSSGMDHAGWVWKLRLRLPRKCCPLLQALKQRKKKHHKHKAKKAKKHWFLFFQQDGIRIELTTAEKWHQKSGRGKFEGALWVGWSVAGFYGVFRQWKMQEIQQENYWPVLDVLHPRRIHIIEMSIFGLKIGFNIFKHLPWGSQASSRVIEGWLGPRAENIPTAMNCPAMYYGKVSLGWDQFKNIMF